MCKRRDKSLLPLGSQPFPAPLPHARLFYRYQDLAPQLVPLDYTTCPEVKVPYELISSMPELKVCLRCADRAETE